jgi:hypothetical protein
LVAGERDVTDATKLLWEQAQRQLSQQSADLDILRTRTIAMLSVAAVAAALFGSRLSHVHSAREAVTVLALCLFAASVVLAAWVVRPAKWRFTYPLQPLINEAQARSARPMDVALSLTHHAEQNRKKNEKRLEGLHMRFSLICLLIGLQVVAWAIAVI